MLILLSAPIVIILRPDFVVEDEVLKPSEALAANRAESRRVVEWSRARNVRVFTSVLRGQDADSRDVDRLIDPTPEPSLFDISAICVTAARFNLPLWNRPINFLWRIGPLAVLMFLVGSFSATAQPGMQLAIDNAGMGLTQLVQPDGGQVTVFYPAAGREEPIRRGPFQISVILDGAPIQGNAHLIVISHGSGGSPWVHANLARTLVQRGFTVALPQHHADNYLDASQPGPASWRLRPREVSEAINIVQRNRTLSRSRPPEWWKFGLAFGETVQAMRGVSMAAAAGRTSRF